MCKKTPYAVGLTTLTIKPRTGLRREFHLDLSTNDLSKHARQGSNLVPAAQDAAGPSFGYGWGALVLFQVNQSLGKGFADPAVDLC